MRVGSRNRIIAWVEIAVPYRPAKDDLLDNVRRVQRVIDAGHNLAIAAEGRIHSGERTILPLNDGPAYFALRCRVPVVPVAINGTSWITAGRRIRIRVGQPIEAQGRATRPAIDGVTAQLEESLRELVRDYPDPPIPGRFWRWFTELFNDWPGGARPPIPND